MTCDTLQLQLSALLDRELPVEAAAEIERHLAVCPECAQVRAELEAVQKMSVAWEVETPNITQRVMQAVALDDQSLLLEEIKSLRGEMEALRAEVNALRRQLNRRLDLPSWSPPARHDHLKDYTKMENDPWNLTRS